MAERHRKEGRSVWQAIALLIVGVILGTILIAPVTAHVDGWAHNWKKHIKPKADKRFVTKAQAKNMFDTHWAFVKGDGTIVAQSGGISVKLDFPGTTVLTFPTTVNDKAIAVTPAWATGDGETVATANACGGSQAGMDCVFIGENDEVFTGNDKDAFVNTVALDGSEADRDFYISVTP